MAGGRIFYPRSRQDLGTQFLRFAIVGTMGYFWDTGTVYLLRPYLGLSAAIVIAYFVAASANWTFNRIWTFRSAMHRGHPILQWLRFLAANSFGFLLNRGTVFFLCFMFPYCAQYPFVPLAVGALAGLAANFSLSRRLVFRVQTPETPLELAKMTTSIFYKGDNHS